MVNMAELPVTVELGYDLKTFLSEPQNII